MYKLKLSDIVLDVYLGVYDFEQKMTQNVQVNLCICYKHIPNACLNDNLDDAICYANINELLIKVSSKKRYKLIEHLAYSLLEELKLVLSSYKVDIYLEVNKNPPLDNVGLASFCVEYICN